MTEAKLCPFQAQRNDHTMTEVKVSPLTDCILSYQRKPIKDIQK
jgi:hypothetical protein